jgi:hypothetical protein
MKIKSIAVIGWLKIPGFLKIFQMLLLAVICFDGSMGAETFITVDNLASLEEPIQKWQKTIALSKFINKKAAGWEKEAFYTFIKENLIDNFNEEEIIKKTSISSEDLNKILNNIAPFAENLKNFYELYKKYYEKYMKNQEKLLKNLKTYQYNPTNRNKDIKFLKKQRQELQNHWLLWNVYLYFDNYLGNKKDANNSTIVYKQEFLDVYKLLPPLMEYIKNFLMMLEQMETMEKNKKSMEENEKKLIPSMEIETKTQGLLKYLKTITEQKKIRKQVEEILKKKTSINGDSMANFIQDHLLNNEDGSLLTKIINVFQKQDEESGFVALLRDYNGILDLYPDYDQSYPHNEELTTIVEKKLKNISNEDILSENLPWTSIATSYNNYAENIREIMENLGILQLIIKKNEQTSNQKPSNDIYSSLPKASLEQDNLSQKSTSDDASNSNDSSSDDNSSNGDNDYVSDLESISMGVKWAMASVLIIVPAGIIWTIRKKKQKTILLNVG